MLCKVLLIDSVNCQVHFENVVIFVHYFDTCKIVTKITNIHRGQGPQAGALATGPAGQQASRREPAGAAPAAEELYAKATGRRGQPSRQDPPPRGSATAGSRTQKTRRHKRVHAIFGKTCAHGGLTEPRRARLLHKKMGRAASAK